MKVKGLFMFIVLFVLSFSTTTVKANIVSPTFSVMLPSTITLEKSAGAYTYSGAVRVKGTLETGGYVTIGVPGSLKMYDVTMRPSNDIPSDSNDQNYLHKEPEYVSVSLSNHKFQYTEISSTTYKEGIVSVTAVGLSAGKWQGNIPFTITYVKDN